MKTVLTIAGSDSSGGAGIQADLKTFEAFGIFGTSAITVLTAQNTLGVSDIFPVDSKFVASQIKAVFDDFEVSAIKLGMLFSTDIMRVVLDAVSSTKTPVVLDPVAVSRAGSILISSDAVDMMRELFKKATIITPNSYEFELFFGKGDRFELAKNFVDSSGISLVIKNIEEKNSSTDYLFEPNKEASVFASPVADKSNTHGTGCTFAAAIAANLALGKSTKDAVQISKEYVYQAITHSPKLGSGNGPVRHRF